MKRFDIVSTRLYTNKAGEEKKQYVSIGRAVEFDDGGMQIELTTIPVGGWWNGKAALYESKPKESSPAAAKAKAVVAQIPDDEDQIPF